MIYTSDHETIKNAKKDVDDARLEIQKQSIQDQIDALDDEIDRYNDLIDQINKAADAQIDALEKIKNKWQEVIEHQEYAKNLSLLTAEFGADAITKILTGNDDDLLARWKANYINTLADIDMESQGYIGDMTQRMAGLYNVDLSSLQNQFQNVKEAVEGVTKAIGNTDIGAGHSNMNTGADPSSGNLTESIDGIGVAADESLPGVTSYMDDIGTSAMNAASAVSSVADAINSIPEEKDVTINVHTSDIGDTPATQNDTEEGVIITSDGHRLRKLCPGDRMFDLMQITNAFFQKYSNNFEKFVPSSFYEHNKQMSEFAKQISNVSNVINNNRNMQPVINGGINITCPGVTSQEVVRQVGVELNNMFSGLHLEAMQQSMMI